MTTIHITHDNIEGFCDALQAKMVAGGTVDLAAVSETADRKRAIAKGISFHHGIEAGDRVYVSYRRAYGIAEELLVKQPNPRGSCASFGVFRVRLEDGSAVEEHPEHLTRAAEQGSAQ